MSILFDDDTFKFKFTYVRVYEYDFINNLQIIIERLYNMKKKNNYQFLYYECIILN